MNMLQFLQAMNPSFDPEEAKLHLATHSETLNRQAIDIYIAGEFDEWQCWNDPGNFNREYVISLISLPPRQDGDGFLRVCTGASGARRHTDPRPTVMNIGTT